MVRVYRPDRPLDVTIADPMSPNTVLELRRGDVGDCPAIIFAPRPGAIKLVTFVSVSFLCGDIETTIRSASESLDELMKISESLR
jgi:hypothetical protein